MKTTTFLAYHPQDAVLGVFQARYPDGLSGGAFFRSLGPSRSVGRTLEGGWWVVTGTMEFDDFPQKVGNGIIIPTDEVHHFSEG